MHRGSRHQLPPKGATGQRAIAALESGLDAVVWIDEHSLIIGANAVACEMLGCDRADAMGRAAADLLPAGHGVKAGVADDVAQLLADPALPARRVERPVTGRHGRTLWTEASITPTEIDGRRVAAVFLRDISSAKRTERRRQIEHRLARVLAAARSGEEIARANLEMLGTGLGFDHAEFWLADRPGNTLRLSAAWRRHGGPFGEAARGLTVRRGEDLAGMGWEIGETVCVDDARTLDGLVRADAVAAEGVRGCAALPICTGRAIAGVVVFARTDSEPLDPELRQTLHSVAVQLGHFAERRLAERRLAEETIAIAAVARATRELTDAVDSTTAGEAICKAALEVCGAEQAYLALPDAERGGLTIRAGAPQSHDGLHFSADGGSASVEAFESGHATFVPDVEQAAVQSVERARAGGIVSGLVQPIIRDGAALGVLGVGWAMPTPTLDASTRLLMRLLADEAASALSRVELVSRLESAARTDPLTGLANVR
ncbi:MAG: putative Hybrid sensor histidine kinase, partial [Solirubrobacteraceae bacterium]|nr:putative Hybrid sensor histidine kinase [Solirubrobacteraceae bacterium]